MPFSISFFVGLYATIIVVATPVSQKVFQGKSNKATNLILDANQVLTLSHSLIDAILFDKTIHILPQSSSCL
jgi:hypothetical protein